MSITIRLKFPSGRYHATPWNRHVNEGIPEWPPSPWRILRALVAVWKRTCNDLKSDQVRRILEQLIAPPKFRLPPYRVAHTRHYMPKGTASASDRTLIFDTFVSINRLDALYIGWENAELDERDTTAFERLLENLNCFGRAEAWVNADLYNKPVEWNCVPSDPTEGDVVKVFCADPESVFSDEHYPKHDPKKLAAGKVKPENYLFDCPQWHLCIDTETIHEHRWPIVPGSRWVNYTRPSDFSEKPNMNSLSTASNKPKHTLARFMLDGPVLPNFTDAILVAERTRKSLMKTFTRVNSPKQSTEEDTPKIRLRSKIFSGKDEESNPSKKHGHAYYLPQLVEGDRSIRHILVYAEDGFGEKEIKALSRVEKLFELDDPNKNLGSIEQKEGIQVQLVGLGKPDDFKLVEFGISTTWVSATPYVGPNHIGLRGQERYLKKAIRNQIKKIFERRGLTFQGVEIELSTDRETDNSKVTDFRRWRSQRADFRKSRPARFVKLTFKDEFVGPLSLGYGAHFGLGLFIPVTNNDS